MAFNEAKNSVIIFCQEKVDLLATGAIKMHLSAIFNIFRDLLEARPLPNMQPSIPLTTVWREAECELYSLECRDARERSYP